MTRIEYALEYNKCTAAELRGFIEARNNAPEPLARRSTYIRRLEEMDKNATFDRFLQLPNELRIMVYDHLVGDPSITSLLQASRQIYLEARAILYASRSLYIYSRFHGYQHRFADFGGYAGFVSFNDTDVLARPRVPALQPTAAFLTSVGGARLALVRKIQLTGITYPHTPGIYPPGPGVWTAEALWAFFEALTTTCTNLNFLQIHLPGFDVKNDRHVGFVSVALSPLTVYPLEVKVEINGWLWRAHLDHPETHMRLENLRGKRGNIAVRWMLAQVAKGYRAPVLAGGST